MVYWSMSTLKLWKHVPRNQNKTSFLTTWKLPATVSQETENIPTSQADALQYSHCSRHDMAKWLSGHDMSWNLNLQFFFTFSASNSDSLRLSETHVQPWDFNGRIVEPNSAGSMPTSSSLGAGTDTSHIWDLWDVLMYCDLISWYCWLELNLHTIRWYTIYNIQYTMYCKWTSILVHMI